MAHLFLQLQVKVTLDRDLAWLFKDLTPVAVPAQVPMVKDLFISFGILNFLGKLLLLLGQLLRLSEV